MKKLITFVVLLSFVFTNIAVAEVNLNFNKYDNTVGLFFDVQTTQQLLGDLNTCQAESSYNSQRFELCKKEVVALDNMVNTQSELLKGLKSDVGDLTKAKDDYKNLYTKADKARLEAIENSPSRTSWFLSGGACATLAFLIIGLLVK